MNISGSTALAFLHNLMGVGEDERLRAEKIIPSFRELFPLLIIGGWSYVMLTAKGFAIVLRLPALRYPF